MNAIQTHLLHSRFLSVLPRIELHGRIYFRHLKCSHQKAEAIQEMRSLAWKWFVRLAERGKDATEFASVLASFAAKAVKTGRRLTGQEKTKDVLSPVAQRRHGFSVGYLPASTARTFENVYAPRGQLMLDAFEERLKDNTQTPVPDQVAFRIDFPEWLESLTPRERQLIRAMAQNERTKDLSERFELSPARISQLRHEFHDDWMRFTSTFACAESTR